MNRGHLLIFTRSPQLGRVKTRIAAAIGDEAALQLHCRLLSHTVHTLAAGGDWETRLWIEGDLEHTLLQELRQQRLLSLHSQQGDDLGERMAAAAQDSLRQGNPVVLVGTDCPALTAAQVTELFARLDEGCDAALVPARDGGYVALALKRFDAALFRDLPWGTADVYKRTTAVLQALGWRWQALDTLWDVDRPEDLETLRESGLMAEAE